MEEGEEKRNHAEEKIEEEKLIATLVGSFALLCSEQLYNYTAVSLRQISRVSNTCPSASARSAAAVAILCPIRLSHCYVMQQRAFLLHCAETLNGRLREWSRLVFGGLLNKLPAHHSPSLSSLSFSRFVAAFSFSLSFFLASDRPTDRRPPTVTYDSEPRLVRGVHLCVCTLHSRSIALPSSARRCLKHPSVTTPRAELEIK